jgi:hypothetical protein
VLHARTEFTIGVSRSGETVRVRVRDFSVVLPRQREYGTDSTTGRGMRLVASISSAWGVEPEGGGKAVWFDLPAGGNQMLVPAWDDIDVDALLASFEDAASDTDGPPVALVAAA